MWHLRRNRKDRVHAYVVQTIMDRPDIEGIRQYADAFPASRSTGRIYELLNYIEHLETQLEAERVRKMQEALEGIKSLLDKKAAYPHMTLTADDDYILELVEGALKVETESERALRLEATIATAKEELSNLANGLHNLWRCNTDEERKEFGDWVADRLEKFNKHPSKIVLNP